MASLFIKYGAKSMRIHFLRINIRVLSFKPFDSAFIPSITWKGELNSNNLSLDSYRAPENVKYKCHWVIPNKCMMGKSPNNDDELMDTLVNQLGITKFVTLTDKGINDQREKIEYIHFPMKNFNVAADEETCDLMSDLMDKLSEDNAKLYIHCNSGHGRAGVVSALLLQCVYGMDDEITRKYLKLIHTTRCDNNIQCNIPEKEAQVNQLKRLNKSMLALYNKCET